MAKKVVLAGACRTAIGTMGGTLIGILIIGVITNGLNLMQINSFWQNVLKGVIIMLAVIIDVQRKKRSSRE